MSAKSLRASVIVCTRNRSESCRAAVARLLETCPADCELIVVDQSADESTRVAISALEHSELVVYVKSHRQGLSAARNQGAGAAGGSLLLFTDDDCLPDPDWIESWCRSFSDDADTGIGFGQVSCPPFDPTKGYTAGFNTRNGTHRGELFLVGAGHVGMGANMVVPRDVWLALGGFDEGLGAGTRFAAGEDTDLAYRAIKAGFQIRHLAAARVWHYGYRPGATASHLMRGYVAGIAAMYCKHARCGDAYAMRLLATEIAHHAQGVAQRILHRTRPLGLVGLVHFLRGVGMSWGSPIDTRRRLYGSMEAAGAN